MSRLALALLATLATAEVAHARVVEKIVAVVGNEIILQSEVEERATPFMREVASIGNPTQRAARSAAIRREVLDRLIDEQLIVQQATELKVNVTSEDVDRSIEQIKRENNLTDETLRAALTQQGMTMATYRQDIKKQILRYKVLGVAVGSRVSIAESEMRAYYEKNMKDAGGDVTVRASHVFVALPDDATPDVVTAKKAQAAAIAERARKGEDFATLARELSQDDATKNEGGDLGTIGKDMLPKPIEETLFRLKVGEVSDPVKAERGFHVLKVVERNRKDAKPFEEVRAEIRQRIYQREVERQTKSYLSELRKKALVEVRL